MRSPALCLAALASLAGGCTSLPWGAGGAAFVAPEREIPGAIVRQLGLEGLERAAERLAIVVSERWTAVGLPDETLAGGLLVSWDGLELELGSVALGLGPYGLEARVDVGAAPATIGLGLGDVIVCELDVAFGPGAWIAPLQLGTDKLGRVQGALKAAVRFEGDVALGVVDGACPALDDLADRVARALAEAAGGVLGDALADALAPALGLDMALAWSGGIAADALGQGFLRASIRARDDDLVELGLDGVRVRFAVGVEAEPHPCVGALALPAPETDDEPGPWSPGTGAEGAVLVRLTALEQALRAAWVAGAACGDHLDPGEGAAAADVRTAWPAVAGYPADTALRLELWPEELPSLGPGDAGGVRLETGRIVVEVWAEDGGSWRLGTLVVSLAIEGELAATTDGFVWLDPTRIEAWPVEVTGGLVAPPPAEEVARVLQPLVESLVLARPLLRLPPSARPSATRTLEVGADFVTLAP
ncbi:MAG: hypothetical protein IT385_16310 [Deltaproteobacteria bacterium]|nr:hypothetical protein [Deltaproteobacteria bacterium]